MTKIDKNILKRLDGAIESTLLGNSDSPDCNVGAAICVLQGGEEVYRKEYGYADKENKIPMKRDSIFRCYSMTKPVTAVAVMILVERGQLVVYDPVSKYIPTFENQQVLTEKGLVPADRQVTIKDLLTMTAGVTYPDASFPAGERMQNMIDKYYADVEAGKPTSTYDLALRIGEQPLAFQPGTQWNYSFCADVLGAVVEVVSGKKYGEFLHDEIFEPLGMVDTDFYVPEDKWDRLMVNYQYMPETETLEPCTWQHLGLTYMHKKKPEFESGGAGLVSTVDDYSKFVLMLLENGTYNGVRILGRKTVQYMTENNLTPEQMPSFNWEQLRGYGYGSIMRHLTDLSKTPHLGSLGEFGWDGWLGTYMTVDQSEDLGIVYVIQKCGGNGHRDVDVIRNIVYSALL